MSRSDTWYRLKQNSCWQHLTISILFVLNSFTKNLLMTKSIEAICDLFNGRASSPYRRTGIHLVFKRWSVISSETNLPILPKIALAALEGTFRFIQRLNVLDWTIKIPKYLITLVHGKTWPVKLVLAHESEETSHRGPIRKQQDFLVVGCNI